MLNNRQWLWQKISDPADTVIWHVVGDANTREILARLSLENFGQAAKPSWLDKQSVAFGYFGEASTEAAICASECIRVPAAQRKQLVLDNVLGFGRVPRPR